MSDDLTDAKRMELVLAAITRIKRAQDMKRAVHADPATTGEDRKRATEAVRWAENQFGWQWSNVDRLLSNVIQIERDEPRYFGEGNRHTFASIDELLAYVEAKKGGAI